jgi:hypothetical protein
MPKSVLPLLELSRDQTGCSARLYLGSLLQPFLAPVRKSLVQYVSGPSVRRLQHHEQTIVYGDRHSNEYRIRFAE